jgi:hypothetical protein
MKPKIIAKDKDHLKQIIEQEMASNGNECDLNHIDVSQVEEMDYIFFKTEFNGDVSQWDVSNVKYMFAMFLCSPFNGDISKWDVRKLKNMDHMLSEDFTGDISQWKPYNVNEFALIFGKMPTPPYWALIKDKDERRKAIYSYHLQKELGQELDSNNSKEKRVKL